MENPTSRRREQPLYKAWQISELINFLTRESKSQLTSIITSAGLLAEELALPHDDSKTKLISDILTSAHYLEARVLQLSDLVKLEVEGFYLELEAIDIDTIIYQVVDQLLPTVRSRHQFLTINLASHPPKIIADPLRVEQVLLNLLSNASKFTPNGGSISISTDKQDRYIVIKVHDNRPCIPPEELHEIFQPYYEIRDDKDIRLSETGLGLVLCKYLVALHGGRIWVESQEHKGNTFAFTLPLRNS